MRFGTCRMAVRREAILKKNIHFSSLFGGGCLYGSGEDSLFLVQCFKSGLKVCSHEYVLGVCSKDESTWFDGYNEKYFFDKGALLACAFPATKHLIKWYFIFKYHRKTKMPLRVILLQVNKGIASFEGIERVAERGEGV